MLNKDESLEPLGNNIFIIINKEYRFSTDTVLLANFSLPNKNQKAAELGSGCAAIPFLWHSWGAAKKITAIEIQQNACNLANRSVKLNKLEKKIEIINADITKEIPRIEKYSYDVVACNPPYKLLGTGFINKNSSRKIARHEEMCNTKDIMNCANNLLKFGGKIFLCQRPERLCEILQTMHDSGLEPKKIRFVQGKKQKQPKLFLIEGKKGAKPGLIALPTLIIEDDKGEFTKEMWQIYNSYSQGRNLN